MDQGQLTSQFCARPQNFAWFLGAGASRSAGLPTATDILWDLKRLYYCREENQEISRQDIKNDAVRERIQAYMVSRGFPALWSDSEYPAYFENIFDHDKEGQRRYLRKMLSEEHVTLNVGQRVFGALLAAQYSRAVFTTNFDSVVEKAVAEVSGQSLAAYHLEGSDNANQALNNEEFPLYCKLHGDFRYDSLKNLPDDLASQNTSLSECLVNAGNRFGFIVTGYSGRDESVMDQFFAVLETNNAFPHGLFWTEIKGFPPLPAVESLLEHARNRGVNAELVPIETFDALLLRLWRNIASKPSDLDKRVCKSHFVSASIPLPASGSGAPLIRLNALPILALPQQCLTLSFNETIDWDALRAARNDSGGNLIFTKSESVWAWGKRDDITGAFANKLVSIGTRELPTDFSAPENFHAKSFVEEAVSTALTREKPLLCRANRSGSFVIANSHAESLDELEPLSSIVGNPFGEIAELFTLVTDDHPQPETIRWAEAVRISLDQKNGALWLQIEPDVWIWPARARRLATDFLDKRRGDRFNQIHNALLDAWIQILLGTTERKAEVSLAAFDDGDESENPAFRIGSRTAYARRLAS